MDDAIVLESLNKTFGDKHAVRDLSLRVPYGGLYGFIGPNGAGKTTTIRMVMSILFPDSGRLSVLGKDSAIQSKDRIGYLPEERGVYRKMRVGSFLKHMARLKGVDGGGLEAKVRGWLDRVGLSDVYKKRCEELSKGMQQKVQFISCVIHEPELLILDEPFSGLDPVNMRLLRDLFLEQHARGVTVIFSTHVMHQAEQLCERIVMIHDGVKVLDDDLASIRARHDPRSLLVELGEGDPAMLGDIEGVVGVAPNGASSEVLLHDGAEPEAVMRRIIGAASVRRIEIRRPTLEDVFVEIAGGESDAETRRELLAGVRNGQGVVA